MFKKFSVLIFGLLLVGCNATAPTPEPMQDEHMNHGEEMMMDDDRLNSSGRHQEWVEVKNGEKTIHTWVVYPEVSEKKPVVLLIHENRGLNDWARSMADQVAEAGYIAVAPDLLSDFSETEKKTSDFADDDAARTALGTLNPEGVMSDLQAVADWAKTIPSSDGKLVSAGFCWGGGKSFEFATKSDDLEVAMVFYGTGPTDASAYANISAPVFGFYGGADERVNATIPASEEAMKAAGKSFEYKIYDGAGHAFMSRGEDPNGEQANIEARKAALERMKEILSDL
jgi:carboxymethylenebutenolidase